MKPGTTAFRVVHQWIQSRILIQNNRFCSGNFREVMVQKNVGKFSFGIQGRTVLLLMPNYSIGFSQLKVHIGKMFSQGKVLFHFLMINLHFILVEQSQRVQFPHSLVLCRTLMPQTTFV